MHYNPFPFLEDNNSTSPLQKGVRGAEWFVTEETTYMKSASTSFNVYECNLYTKGNSCGGIDIFVIEITFDNYYIHI